MAKTTMTISVDIETLEQFRQKTMSEYKRMSEVINQLMQCYNDGNLEVIKQYTVSERTESRGRRPKKNQNVSNEKVQI